MQRLFTKKIFILLLLFFTSNIYSQAEEAKITAELHKMFLKKTIPFFLDKDSIILAIKLHSLTDYEKLYSDVKAILKNKNINLDDLNYKNHSLYYVKIYSYILSIEDDNCNYIDKKNIITPSPIYVSTIEIGEGISPMANNNGMPLNIAYSYKFFFDKKIAITIRWWDTSKMPSGKFIFVNSDNNVNLLYDFVIFFTEE